jgi:hypothetical protein
MRFSLCLASLNVLTFSYKAAGMSLSPQCEVNGTPTHTPTTDGVNVAPSTLVSITLVNPAGTSQWYLEVFGTDETITPPALSGVNTSTHLVTSPSTTVTFLSPSTEGSAIGFRSRVEGVGGPVTTTFGIYTLTSFNTRVGFATETREGDASFGWAAKLNPLIRSGGGGGGGGPNNYSLLDIQDSQVIPAGQQMLFVGEINIGSGGELVVDGEVADVSHVDSPILILPETVGTPTPEADKAKIYSKEVSGITELFILDDQGQEIQVTSNGSLTGGGGGGGSPSGSAGGDLGGTYPNPAVAKVNGISVSGTPSSGQVLTASSSSAATWQTPSGGGGSPTGSAGGDLGGTYPNPTVTQARGLKSATTTVSVSSATAPTNGQILTATSGTAASWQAPSIAVTSVTGLGSNVSDFLANPSSFNLAVAVSDETGNGPLVFANNPVIVGADLGTPSAIDLTNATGRASSAQTADKITTSGTPVSISSTSPTSGQVLQATSSTAATWQTLTSGPASQIATSGTPVSISSTSPTSGQVLTASSGTAASWQTPSASPSGSAGGDLSGTYPNPTVAKVNGVTVSGTPTSGQVITATSGTAASWQTPLALSSTTPTASDAGAGTVGTGTTGARSDHKHSISTGAPSSLAVGGSNTTGTSSNLARADHVHAIPPFGTTAGTFMEGSQTAGGDLGGTLPNPTVVALHSSTTSIDVVSATAPISGQVLTATSSTAAIWQTPTPGPASQIATSGTPVTISSTTPASGQVIIASSGTAAAWGAVPITGISGFGTGVATFLGTPTSANLAAAVPDETGTGALVFATSPTLIAPALGTPSALVLTNSTGRASSAQTADQISTSGTSVSIGSTAPTNGQVLTATSATAAVWQSPASGVLLTSNAPTQISVTSASPGTGTEAARDDHTHNVATGSPSSISVGGTNTPGTSSSLARADHTHALPNFGTTAGTFMQGNQAAGGDLSGSLPNPTVAKVNGVTVTGSTSTGQVLTATSSSAATWQTPSTANATSLATSGASVNVSSAAPPSAGQVLTATSSTSAAWITASAGAAGDLVTTGGANVNVSASGPPSTGQVLTATNSTHATWQTPTSGAASDLATTGVNVNVSGAAPPSAGQVLTATSSTSAAWQSPASGVTLASTAPVDVEKSAADVGTDSTAARADHKHDVSTAAAINLSIGGSNSEGTSSSLARADHTHGLPTFGNTAGTFAEGSDSRFTNDRTASGIRTSTSVVGVSTAAAPSSGQVLTATSSTSATWQTPTATPSGSASGDLGGSYPNPTVIALHNTAGAVNVGSAAAPSTGQVLTATDSTHATWQNPTANPIGAAGGDLGGSYPNPNVIALKSATTSVNVGSASAPTSGQVLTATSATAAIWQTPTTGASVTSSAPANVTKSTAVVGTDTTAARADHKHDVSTATAVNLTVGGSSSEGASTSLARADHTHGLPNFGTTAGTFAQGSDTRFTNDRTASGLRTSTTVVSMSSATAPTSGQVLTAIDDSSASWQDPTGGGGGLTTDLDIKTGDFTALAGTSYYIMADNGGSPITVTLPTSPSEGDTVEFSCLEADDFTIFDGGAIPIVVSNGSSDIENYRLIFKNFRLRLVLRTFTIFGTPIWVNELSHIDNSFGGVYEPTLGANWPQYNSTLVALEGGGVITAPSTGFGGFLLQDDVVKTGNFEADLNRRYYVSAYANVIVTLPTDGFTEEDRIEIIGVGGSDDGTLTGKVTIDPDGLNIQLGSRTTGDALTYQTQGLHLFLVYNGYDGGWVTRTSELNHIFANTTSPLEEYVVGTNSSGAMIPIPVSSLGGGGGGGTALVPTTDLKSADYAANVGEIVLVDVTGGAVNITVPSSPTNGQQFGVKIIGAATFTCTVDAGVSSIEGVGTLSMSTDDEWALLMYTSATTSWIQIG